MSGCNLVFDIGNTLIKVAVFNKRKCVFKKAYNRVLVRDIQALDDKFAINAAIVSSVRKKSPRFIQHLSKNYHLILLDYKTKIPIVNLYKTPKTLGLDRLAAVVGAHMNYPKKNNFVIDLGTCIKYDFIDNTGHYHGGNIAPGLEMRLEAMHQMTSKLPRVKKSKKNSILGRSTTEALQNGGVWGIKSEIEGFIKTLTKSKGKITVILTGGDAEYFGDMIESKIFVIPNLVLNGLNEILLYNQELKASN